jgi:hypothetical protein
VGRYRPGSTPYGVFLGNDDADAPLLAQENATVTLAQPGARLPERAAFPVAGFAVGPVDEMALEAVVRNPGRPSARSHARADARSAYGAQR